MRALENWKKCLDQNEFVDAVLMELLIASLMTCLLQKCISTDFLLR